ncbi:hypothetical protein NLJ89_g2723 [Agrocybe chaxingu]|uniref:Alpha-glucosidase n=1 Tax=Agrocybe chaxingu TaxID=84603 RepID=A0A9W8K699_9AGAR|nr:hypothetical protein NLJ89_g2723 [Agrocybe chaxingu]
MFVHLSLSASRPELSFLQHNQDNAISQEFYLWSSVEQAAKNAIDIRYRLMDYIYTAFHQAHIDGTPILHPVWFKYPKDANTFAIEHQFFYGDSILVSPVTDEGATSISIYLPRDVFYDFTTLAPLQGTGSSVTLTDVDLTKIPVHIKGGTVLPLRVSSAMTTTLLQQTDFEFVVAPDGRGAASGSLYIDDGENLVQRGTTEVGMVFRGGTIDGVWAVWICNWGECGEG